MKLSRPRIEKGHFATKTKIKQSHNSIKTGHVGCHSEHQGIPTSRCYNYLTARRMNRLRRSIRACRRSLILKQSQRSVCRSPPLAVGRQTVEGAGFSLVFTVVGAMITLLSLARIQFFRRETSRFSSESVFLRRRVSEQVFSLPKFPFRPV